MTYQCASGVFIYLFILFLNLDRRIKAKGNTREGLDQKVTFRRNNQRSLRLSGHPKDED